MSVHGLASFVQFLKFRFDVVIECSNYGNCKVKNT